MSSDRPLSLTKVFAAPLAIAAISAFGLVAALLADGVWDIIASLCLSIPTVTILWAVIAAKINTR